MSASTRVQGTGSSAGSFVESILRLSRTRPEGERRTDQRENLSVPIWVQPLLFDFSPDGPTYKTVTRDISFTGIGFIQSEPMRHKYAELQIANPDGPPDRAIVEIRHCTEIGHMGLLHSVGASFLPVNSQE